MDPALEAGSSLVPTAAASSMPMCVHTDRAAWLLFNEEVSICGARKSDLEIYRLPMDGNFLVQPSIVQNNDDSLESIMILWLFESTSQSHYKYCTCWAELHDLLGAFVLEANTNNGNSLGSSAAANWLYWDFDWPYIYNIFANPM